MNIFQKKTIKQVPKKAFEIGMSNFDKMKATATADKKQMECSV